MVPITQQNLQTEQNSVGVADLIEQRDSNIMSAPGASRNRGPDEEENKVPFEATAVTGGDLLLTRQMQNN